MFKTFARASHGLVWLSLLYLMVGVAFIPVPRAVLGAWIGSSSFNNQVVAAVSYGAVGTVGALLLCRAEGDVKPLETVAEELMRLLPSARPIGR